MTELTIWKYALNGNAMQSIDMPAGAEVLTVQMQNGAPVVYALVDPKQSPETHQITIHGTGHPIPSREMGHYVGTFQDGWYVGHVFDWTPIQQFKQPERESATAVRMNGVTAGDINISGVTVNHGR